MAEGRAPWDVDVPAQDSTKPRGWSRAPTPVTYSRSVRADWTIGAYVADHLAIKAAMRDGCPRWLASVHVHLMACVAFFGAGRLLASIAPKDVELYVAYLLTRSNGRGGVLSAGTVNHYINSLSNMFRRAERDGAVLRNPVRLIMARPKSQRSSTLWLEPHEIGCLLDAASHRRPLRPDLAIPFLLELVAVFAYCGLRTAEALGLELDDIRLDRGVLLVRPNRWRGLKNGESERAVPVWAELATILHPFVTEAASNRSLAFPAPNSDGKRPLRNIRRAFDQLPLPARIASSHDGGHVPRLRPRILRHSYCAARLQTLDEGAPVSPYTVAREMGHTDLRMVLRIYGHLGKVRLRTADVSFPRASL